MSSRPMLTLDIGTRKVAGLVTTAGPRGLRILGAEVMEHSTRAMLDGQIHDVVAVADVVSAIAKRLERHTGSELREVAVAAAGRALRTVKGQASRELSGLAELTADEVFSLELEAVQAAQSALGQRLREGERPQDYHYVGHSVTGCRLDGLPLGNLVGQRGNLAEVDVIATFLPRGVVDSLQAVLHRCSLEMTALTLEPIAAITVAVPQSMRHLNLALVDIGAGTSDIAVTAKGAVLAYDMVPIAGDEITEALSEAYLLDFSVGERVKRQIGAGQPVRVTDILGQTTTLSAAELTEAVQPAARRLANQISQRILTLNGGQAPQAVLLVGGGSLTPGLAAYLAAEVGLPPQRVAVRGRDAVTGVEGATKLLGGPDAITPIGIAVAARDRSTLGFSYVYVNGRGVRLFHPKRLTVADALLAGGVAIKELQGSIGKGLTVTLNGSLRIVRGTFGRPARIIVNNEPATLETPIEHHDRIEIEPGEPGQPGRATVADVAPEALDRLEIVLNGEPCVLKPLIAVNGQAAEPTQELQDNDVVMVRALCTVEDVLLNAGYEDPGGREVLHFWVNGKADLAVRPLYRVRVNGAPAGPGGLAVRVQPGDHIVVEPTEPLVVGDILPSLVEAAATIQITLNGTVHALPFGGAEVRRNGQKADPVDRLIEGDQFAIAEVTGPPIFASLLPLAGITPSPPPGMHELLLRLNGSDAEFITPLADGDVAEVRWV